MDTTAAITRAMSVSIKAILKKSHHQNHANVNQYQERKGVAEGNVHYMPKVEDLLRARQEEDALGERSLPPGDGDGSFQFAVARGQQPSERGDACATAERSIPQTGDAERPQQIEQQHVDQSCGNWELIDSLLTREAQGRAHVGLS